MPAQRSEYTTETTAATMQDIATRCGVHQSTVQRALAGSSKVRADTAERIRAVAVEMNYDPDHYQAARRLACRRHRKPVVNQALALFIRNFARNPYFHTIFQGIADRAAEERYDLLCVTQPFGAPTDVLPHSIARGEVDGAIFAANTEELPILVRRLRAQSGFGARPLVSLFQPGPDCSAVLVDEYGGARATVAALLVQGHRHLLHFYDESSSDYHGQQRLAGYRQAYLELGLNPSDCLHHVWFRRPYDGKASMTAPLLELLREHPEISAIVARNDSEAMAIAEVLEAERMRVPEDMSLVGFDDLPAAAQGAGGKGLTTVRVPLEQVGREAVSMLLERITGRTQVDKFVSLPVSLVVRGSTSSFRAGSSATH